ncbi:MAG TPA: hypothetical protein PLP23_11895 [Panacibacter sp.]|nr:hypothetical protein [Panacibacter sp.]
MKTPEDLMNGFEEWFEQNKHHLPEETQKQILAGANNISFVLFWKRYEYLLKPKFYNLLSRQFPNVAAADESYAKHVLQIIEHRIFETAEFAWKMVSHNRQGMHPAQVYKMLYPMALKDTNCPGYSKKIYDENSIPEGWLQFGAERAKKMVEEHNADTQNALNWLNNFNKEVIALLQEDLLELLPDLLNISPDWWKMYKFLMLDQCNMWRARNNYLDHLISLNMTGDWLDKTLDKQQEEIKRRRDKVLEEELKNLQVD